MLTFFIDKKSYCSIIKIRDGLYEKVKQKEED
jgi:hypothetical protein